LIAAIAPVRSLLVAVSSLTWKSTGEHLALQALDTLRTQYAAGDTTLAVEVSAVRLCELKQRHRRVPRAVTVPEEFAAVSEAGIDTAMIEAHWDSLVHLAASVSSGHAIALTALARCGSAARGDPIYDAGVQLGKLLRTAFLADYFVNASFRRELRRVLKRGEAVNALKRTIYTGRVGPAQARRADEMQAVADALSLLANIVMAWNTAQMQAVLDRWANRRQVVPPELTGRIAPTRLEGVNLRGVFPFPLECYAGQILPLQPAARTSAGS
jgi:Tn3 transposase DDE domain